MDTIEKKIIAVMDARRDDIIAFARDIYTHGELGYKETRTASKFAEALSALGVKRIDKGLAITGVKGYLPGASPGPTVALIGEMDALRIPGHEFANAETQAAHCCGHHAQLAGVVGAAMALTVPEVAAALGGTVVFFAVPAEEYGEIAFKNRLADEGKIRYGGGKCELIRIGAFDDIDVSIVHHASNEGLSVGNGSSNGFVSKVIRILGRAAHAAAAPELGVNALNAAVLGHSALQCQRETFKDSDAVRVHPIITKGGDLVNVVPDEVVIETLVRAKTPAAIADAARKTDRAYKAGAFAVGAGYEIATMPGYLPRIPAAPHEALVTAAAIAAGNAPRLIDPAEHGNASSDVGDIMHIHPVLGFTTGGTKGAYHSPAFAITDEEEAYIQTAKIFALGAYELLRDGAKSAKETAAAFKPVFTKDTYVAFMESMVTTEKAEVSGNE